MSEAYRRSEGHRGGPRAQGSEPRRPPGQQGIDPGQAAEFRRRLDYQGSAELIPTAGPDAPADQGPAIKAVWAPDPVGALPSGPGARRRDRRPTGRAGHSGAEHSHAAGAGRRKKRTLVVGGAAAAAVAAGAIGIMGMSGGKARVEGAATTVLPASSPGASPTGQAANSTIGSSLSITGSSPSRSATPSKSPSATASQSKAPTGAASATASRSAGPSPSPSASPHKTSCFLFICG